MPRTSGHVPPLPPHWGGDAPPLRLWGDAPALKLATRGDPARPSGARAGRARPPGPVTRGSRAGRPKGDPPVPRPDEPASSDAPRCRSRRVCSTGELGALVATPKGAREPGAGGPRRSWVMAPVYMHTRTDTHTHAQIHTCHTCRTRTHTDAQTHTHAGTHECKATHAHAPARRQYNRVQQGKLQARHCAHTPNDASRQ